MIRKFVPMVLALLLAGCGTTVGVLGGCPIPENLDYHAENATDLPEVVTEPDVVLKDDMEQRTSRKVLAHDFNSLHDYVRDNCK